MNLLNLFSVEVLDTRLSSPTDEKRKQSIQLSAGRSRWKTPEFYFYAVVFLFAVPLMFKAAIDASSSTSPNFELYKNKLSEGWLFGRLVDNSDMQYSGFRDNFPYLVAVLTVHRLARYFVTDILNYKNRVSFDAVFSVIYLFTLHGVNFFKIAILLIINYQISKLEDRKLSYTLTWVFGVGVLFANELTYGYQFKRLGDKYAWLDAYAGIMSRWDVHFNFTMLRMVSYNVDRLQALDQATATATTTASTATLSEKTPSANVLPSSPSEYTEKQRIETPRALTDYRFINYFAYTTYTPLYIAGPIITFNDYMFQSENTLSSINFERTSKYFIRFLICLFTMEFLLHFTYVVAISQARAWNGDSPFQISMIALFNLNIIWLKLLLPWRLFRLWGLIDGIDAPENMIRCVDNNYSAMSFWRSWHRSYNRWVTRYIYIPLGGSNRPIVNSLIVFTFVAFWHDIQLRLLLWGWLIVFFILPEVAATLLFPAKKYGNNPYYRYLCAIGGVCNIWMMMIANLIGFCVGADGMSQMLSDMFATAEGLKYVIFSTFCLFVGVQAMFEFRETEKRKGINLRC